MTLLELTALPQLMLCYCLVGCPKRGSERPRTKLAAVFSIPLSLCVRVEARQQEIHTPEAENDHQEPEDRVDGGPPAFPSSRHAGMDVRAVDQPHNQRPR